MNIEKGDYQKVTTHLDELLKFALENKSRLLESAVYALYSILYFKQEEYPTAVDYAKRAKSIYSVERKSIGNYNLARLFDLLFFVLDFIVKTVEG